MSLYSGGNHVVFAAPEHAPEPLYLPYVVRTTPDKLIKATVVGVLTVA
jgi:hypothetical protein